MALIGVAPAQADTYSVTGTRRHGEPAGPLTSRSSPPSGRARRCAPRSTRPTHRRRSTTSSRSAAARTAQRWGADDQRRHDDERPRSASHRRRVDLSTASSRPAGGSAVGINRLTVAGGSSPSLGGNILVGPGCVADADDRARDRRQLQLGRRDRELRHADPPDRPGRRRHRAGLGRRHREPGRGRTVQTTIFDSTIAKNSAASGAGLFSIGNATTRLTHVTIGRNTARACSSSGRRPPPRTPR